MLILVKLIGIVIVCFGLIFLLKPQTMKNYMSFWVTGKRIYMGALINILIGIVFLLGASQCRLVGFIIAVGIMSLLKGIILFISGPERLKSMLRFWSEKPAAVVRLMALIAIAFGALLIYSA